MNLMPFKSAMLYIKNFSIYFFPYKILNLYAEIKILIINNCKIDRKRVNCRNEISLELLASKFKNFEASNSNIKNKFKLIQ